MTESEGESSTIYQVSNKIWRSFLSTAVIMLLACVALCWRINFYYPGVIVITSLGLILIVLIVWFGWKYRSQWILLDSNSLIVNQMTAEITLEWQEIDSIRLEEEKEKRLIHLGVKDEITTIDITDFDEMLWEDIESRVPVDALQKGERELLILDEKESEEDSKTFAGHVGTFTVWQTTDVVFGWVMVVVFVLIADGGLDQGTPIGALWVVLPLLLFGLYLLSTRGKLSLDHKGVSIRTILGHFHMQWDEIDEVRTSTGTVVTTAESVDVQNLLFYSKNKWLLFTRELRPNPPQKIQDFNKLLRAYLRHHSIAPREVSHPLPVFYPFKNCRI